MKAILLICLSVVALAAAQPSSQCQQGIPFGSQPQNVAPVWYYYIQQTSYTLAPYPAAWNNPPPANWNTPGFNPATAGWASGGMPFGEYIFCGSSYSGCQASGCMSQWVSNAGPAAPNGTTDWPRGTILYLVSSFTSTTTGSQFQGQMNIVVDNDLLGLWINGNPVTTSNCPPNSGTPPDCRSGCTGVSTILNEPIPGADVVVGVNSIAVQVRDDGTNVDTGNQSFCDIQVVVTPVYSSSGQGVSTSTGTCACLTNPT